MPVKSSLISAGLLLLLLVLPDLASAASAYGFGGRRSLLAFRNLSASFYLEYQFERSDIDSKTKTRLTSHGFTEEFSVAGNYALYKPDFWRGRYTLTFGADQITSYRDSKKNSQNDRFLQTYEFYNEVFYFSRTPMVLKAILKESRVGRKYAEDYYLTTEAYVASMRIKNRTLPSSITYADSHVETSGLSANRTSDAQSLSMALSHSLQTVSATGLSYSRTRSSEIVAALGRRYTNDRSVSAVNNTLRWPDGKDSLSLHSTYRYTEYAGENEGRERNWEEELNWKPGRALRVGLIHKEHRKLFEGVSVEQVSDRGSLSYHLFQSLTLSLFLSETNRIFLNGEQTNQAATVRVGYKKNLHKGRRFALNVEQAQEDVERDLTVIFQDVLGETLTVDLVGFNFLQNPNVNAASVVVQDQSGTSYFQGIDYIISTIGELSVIDILPGSAISDGDQLSVNYSYLVNPSIAYRSDRTHISTFYSLYDGALRFSARYSTSDRTQTAGEANIISLDSFRVFSFDVVGKYKPYHFNARYSNTDTTNYEIQLLEASWGFEGKIAGGALMLDVGDVYQTYRAEEEYVTNRVSTRAIYRYRISKSTTMKAEAEGLLITGDGTNRKVASLATDFDIRLRKTIFRVSLEEEYLDYETRTSWSELFMVSMRRNF